MDFFSIQTIKHNLSLFNILKLFFFLLPISLILGNAAVNINSVLIVLISLFIFFRDKNFLNFYKKILFIFIFFLFLFALNIWVSSSRIDTSIAVLGVIRYFILFLSLLYILEKDNNFLKSFSKFLIFVLLFVSSDLIIQYLFGKDIFGIENTSGSNHGNRLNGPFGSEYVVGSYLTKFFFFSLIYFILSKKNFNWIFIYLVIIVTISFLVKERMATIMLLFTSFIFIISFQKLNFFKKISYMSILIFLIFSIISLEKNVKNHLISRSLDQIGLNQLLLANGNKTENNPRIFFDSQWGAHYLTSFEIFLDNPFLGTGIKTFRHECNNPKYSTINSASKKIRCNTHPHNFYLEFLAETGVLIFIPFILLNFILAIKLIYISYSEQKIRNLSIIILCSYIIMFFPIQSTGAFFSTWNGFFYWLNYSFVGYLLRK